MGVGRGGQGCHLTPPGSARLEIFKVKLEKRSVFRPNFGQKWVKNAVKTENSAYYFALTPLEILLILNPSGTDFDPP